MTRRMDLDIGRFRTRSEPGPGFEGLPCGRGQRIEFNGSARARVRTTQFGRGMSQEWRIVWRSLKDWS